jgi:hypothetical protein
VAVRLGPQHWQGFYRPFLAVHSLQNRFDGGYTNVWVRQKRATVLRGSDSEPVAAQIHPALFLWSRVNPPS